MSPLSIRSRLGRLLGRLFPNGWKQDVHLLKQEIQALRRELYSLEASQKNSLKQEAEILRNDLQGGGERELSLLKQEIDILRNEIQENIAAIHRLEILTLAERIDLLRQFQKALPPTLPGKTRQSFKPLGYSFGIITNGARTPKLKRLVYSIRAQNIPNEKSEVLIAGNVAGIEGFEGVKVLPMSAAAAEGRLGAMRNALAKEARFNKFVCLDDDFLLHPGWADAIEEVKGDFDIATSIILNPDLSRYCDWVNLIENYTFLRSYSESFNTCQYMTGGYGIYKDYIFLEHAWKDDLGFYQGEDVCFSRRLFTAGYQLKFIPKAMVMHDDERYRQKGYGVIRSTPDEIFTDLKPLTMKMEKLCPRTLT